MATNPAPGNGPDEPQPPNNIAFWLTAGALLSIVLFLLFFRPWGLEDFFNVQGNAASVLGLYVSLVGFALTVWAVLKTRRSTWEAQQQVRQAVDASREETRKTVEVSREEMRRAVEKIAIQLLRDECETLYRLVTTAIQAATEGAWHRVTEKLQETRSALVRLVSFKQLELTEKQALETSMQDLSVIVTYIGSYKAKEGASRGLPKEKREPLELLLKQSETIVARLRRQALEIPNVT